MAVNFNEVIYAALGFLLVGILAPIGLGYAFSVNSTFNATGTAATWATSFTIFQVLFPILYLIGTAIYFIPKIRGK